MYLLEQTFICFLCIGLLGCSQSGDITKMSLSENGQHSRPKDVSKIIFAATEYDLGQMQQGTQKAAVFELFNLGDQDLKLEQIHSTCGCTTTLPKDQVIRPGRSSEITVTYSSGLSVGPQKKKITLITNDPQNKEIDLWISAYVQGTQSTAAADKPEVETSLTPALSSVSHKDSLTKPTRQTVDFLKQATSQ